MKHSHGQKFRRLFRLPASASEVERDVQDEIRFHLDSRILELEMQGHTTERARNIAHREYGDVAESRSELSRVDHRIVSNKLRINFFDVLRQDVQYACRGLIRSPGLTIAIIVTFGLGVGANAAIFTVLDRVFLQTPAGVVDGSSIRRLYAHRYRKSEPWNLPNGQVLSILYGRDFVDMQQATRGLARIAGEYLDFRSRLMPSKERALVSYATPGYFDLLGIRPAMGRMFAPNENSVTGAAVPVAVISHAFWRRHFAAVSDVIGKTVRVDDHTFTIIGVAAREFEGTELQSVDMWVPLANYEGGVLGMDALHLFAKLESGTRIEHLDGVLSSQYRATHLGDGVAEDSSRIVTSPIVAARAPENAVNVINGMPKRSLQLLTRIAGVGVIVLIIAIANVASLLLMRAIRRRREIAVRLALGISRGRLVTQLMIENALLGFGGGVAALGVALLTGNALRVSLTSANFRWTETLVDQRVVIVAALLAIGSSVLAGLAPATFALRANVASYLKTSHSVGGHSGTSLRNALLIVQLGLCMALLASAGVFVQSLRRAGTFDRGFDSENVVQISVLKGVPDTEAQMSRIQSRLKELPGVVSVARSAALLRSLNFSSKVGPNFRDTVGVGPRGPWIEFVDTDYFTAAGLRIVAGRSFTAADGFVIVLNESLARGLWPKGDAIGKCVHVREPQSPCREIVGVVRDVVWDVMEDSKLRVYIPLYQAWKLPPAIIPDYLIVRTRTPATATIIAELRTALDPIMSDRTDLTIQTVSESLAPQLQPWKLATKLFLTLGGLGLIAAAVGIYGLVSYDVTQRTREIGLRVALGASSLDIYRVVLRSSAQTVAYGLAAGIGAALVAGRVMSALMFETPFYDITVLTATALILLTMAMIAGFAPTRRAVRVDPRVALTAE